MSLGNTKHQKPGKPGRSVGGEGEARPSAKCDEVDLAGHVQEGSGRKDLLQQSLSRENIVEAWKRVKANKGSAGVERLTIEQTGDVLKTQPD